MFVNKWGQTVGIRLSNAYSSEGATIEAALATCEPSSLLPRYLLFVRFGYVTALMLIFMCVFVVLTAATTDASATSSL